MLENNLKFARIELKTIKILAPLFLLVASIWYLTTSKDQDKMLCLVILIVIGGLIGAFVILRSYTKKVSLERYVVALKNKQFDEALNCGRVYYAVKRNGLKGASGDGLTIYDEQAIANDISAYSKI